MLRYLVPVALVSIFLCGCGRSPVYVPYRMVTMKPVVPSEPAPADALDPSNEVADFDSLSPEEHRQILGAILSDILKHPRHEHIREFYGSPANQLVLVTNPDYGIPWPDGYLPLLPGWAVARAVEGAAMDAQVPRRMGIRIDQFALRSSSAESSLLGRAPIAVTVLNAGGPSNGEAVGGCLVYFDIEHVDGVWQVEFAGAEDP